MRIASLITTVVSLLIVSHTSAEFIAGPVEWKAVDGGNGHYYGLFGTDDVTWTEARDAVQGLTLLGSQGHLVTITNQAESNFLKDNFSDYIGDPTSGHGMFPRVPGIRAWIGLTDAAQEGQFRWVTGEPVTFTNWAPPEPNNLGNEDYVFIWRRDYGTGPLWSWNDSGNWVGPADGFFVEFEGPFSPVPEPSTLAIVSIMSGCGVYWRIVKRRRK